MMTCYLIIINIIGFIICYIDKQKAIKHKYRIPENLLLIISLLGGCLGFIIGMFLFHHKTRKLKFEVLEPLFLIFWIYLLLEIL